MFIVKNVFNFQYVIISLVVIQFFGVQGCFMPGQMDTLPCLNFPKAWGMRHAKQFLWVSCSGSILELLYLFFYLFIYLFLTQDKQNQLLKLSLEIIHFHSSSPQINFKLDILQREQYSVSHLICLFSEEESYTGLASS